MPYAIPMFLPGTGCQAGNCAYATQTGGVWVIATVHPCWTAPGGVAGGHHGVVRYRRAKRPPRGSPRGFEEASIPRGFYTRECSVCRHPERRAFEFQCAIGRPVAIVAREFKMREDTARRHWRLHVPLSARADMIAGKTAMANLAAKSRAEDRSLLDYLAIMRSSLFRLFSDCSKRNDANGASTVAARLLSVLESIGRLNGELREAAAAQGIAVNVINGNVTQATIAESEIAAVQSCVIRALRDEPTARAKVIRALDELSAPAAGNGHDANAPLTIEHQPREAAP
jgi:hypothetical protein